MIERPTAILNPTIAQQNIQNMADKAKRNAVRFRPHFKTHQSTTIGEWFRNVGVTAVTVSSVSMACYFADAGWQDITIAFPMNWLEIDKINTLAATINLHLLVESVDTVQFLAEKLTAPVNIWLKIDTGYHRTGILWSDLVSVQKVVDSVRNAEKLTFKGLLTHSGHSYKAKKKRDIERVYRDTVEHLNVVKTYLLNMGIKELALSIGDTPCCSILDTLREVDEIRPGNFVFYDWMQVEIGSCQPSDIAVAIACPVVAKHPERNTLVIYGGAIHFSKDFITDRMNRRIYGVVVRGNPSGWDEVVPKTYITSLSQEHGIIETTSEFLKEIKIGDIVMVFPTHACLAVDLLGSYRTTDGEKIAMFQDN